MPFSLTVKHSWLTQAKIGLFLTMIVALIVLVFSDYDRPVILRVAIWIDILASLFDMFGLSLRNVFKYSARVDSYITNVLYGAAVYFSLIAFGYILA